MAKRKIYIHIYDNIIKKDKPAVPLFVTPKDHVNTLFFCGM